MTELFRFKNDIFDDGGTIKLLEIDNQDMAIDDSNTEQQKYAARNSTAGERGMPWKKITLLVFCIATVIALVQVTATALILRRQLHVAHSDIQHGQSTLDLKQGNMENIADQQLQFEELQIKHNQSINELKKELKFIRSKSSEQQMQIEELQRKLNKSDNYLNQGNMENKADQQLQFEELQIKQNQSINELKTELIFIQSENSEQQMQIEEMQRKQNKSDNFISDMHHDILDLINGTTNQKMQNEELQQGQNLSQKIKSTTVGFTAHFIDLGHNSWLTANSIIPFNSVYFNEGGGFNMSSGQFHCPEDGIYLFSFVVESKTNFVVLEIMKNGIIQGQFIKGTTLGVWGSGSATVVFRLNAGESVWLQCQQSLTLGAKTMFSGILIG